MNSVKVLLIVATFTMIAITSNVSYYHSAWTVPIVLITIVLTITTIIKVFDAR